MCSLGHKKYSDPVTAVTPEFHKNAGMEHGNGSWGRSMAVGRPCMERVKSSQHPESNKKEREEETLSCHGQGFPRDLNQVEGQGAAVRR